MIFEVYCKQIIYPIYLEEEARTSEQTQNICITLVQSRHNVFDVGPTLYKCYANVLY